MGVFGPYLARKDLTEEQFNKVVKIIESSFDIERFEMKGHGLELKRAS